MTSLVLSLRATGETDGDQVFRFGVAKVLHSDQGLNVQSRLIQEVLDRLGVSKIRATPLVPAVSWNGVMPSEDDRGESEQGGFYSTSGLGREATYLHAG